VQTIVDFGFVLAKKGFWAARGPEGLRTYQAGESLFPARAASRLAGGFSPGPACRRQAREKPPDEWIPEAEGYGVVMPWAILRVGNWRPEGVSRA
jgi:hypothetical protein